MPRLLFIILVIISSPVFAFKVVPLKDNETANLSISSNELNRIFVTTDRIVETYGLEGAFKLEKDEEQGNIYLIPIGYYKTHSFNLFVKTENGHNFTLHLTPADVESKTIGLKPLSPAKQNAKHWEMNTPYEEVIINLIRNMSIAKVSQGYAVIHLGTDQPKQKRYPLTFQLMTIYRGDHIEGQAWLVTNVSNRNIHLNPKNFHDRRILAASFDKKTLNKNESAKLYWIKSYAS